MILNVVEPTFENDAGHCRSFVESLSRAADGSGVILRVWAGKGASLTPRDDGGVEVKRYFFRRLRRVQAYFLYRRLLCKEGRILVSTAGRTDMTLLSAASTGSFPPNKVFLYVHWVRPTEERRAFYRRMAQWHPETVLMGPTATVADFFRECGFRHARVVPYPITPMASAGRPPASVFDHFLFAGAPRRDKGFGRFVSMVELMKARGEKTPVFVQTSAEHYGKTDATTREDLSRLHAIGYEGLRTFPETLDAMSYAKLFEGAVCLQPYDRDDFADRVSGVTLDALSGGSPVVVPSGSWMARIAVADGAGIAVDELDPDSLLDAATRIAADYGRFRDNALRTGLRLQEENDARRLFAEVTA